jgi:hypothetical protein
MCRGRSRRALLMTALVAILAAGEGTPFLYFQF